MTQSNRPKLDTDNCLYLFWDDDGGHSCLGFKYAQQRAEAIAQWIGEPIPDPSIWGEEAGYDEYERLMQLGKQYSEKTNTRCNAELIPELIGLEGKRVEVVDSSGATRRFYVGKSTGWMPCHLEIAKINSPGGGATYNTPFRSVRTISGKSRY